MLMLLFSVGNNLYAIPSTHIVEVIPRIPYREVFQVPQYLAGVFNYRGTIVPIIDLCQVIHGTPSKMRLNTRIIIISAPQSEGHQQCMGLIAERVIETTDKNATDIKITDIVDHNAQYLKGMVIDSKGMIQLVNLEYLFNQVPQLNSLAVGL
jgi:chemotaxis-related protein WspB